VQVFNSKTEINEAIEALKADNLRIGLVPTMGALHVGHVSLIEKGIEENDVVVVSIFVNPTQFDNKEDLVKYPRTLERDINLLNKVSTDKILVYTPSVEDIYGSDVLATKFDFDGLEFEMEGQFRHGHFDGVGTIVKRFFEIIKPHKAYFGEKDFQQLQIIKKLVEKCKLDVTVVGCDVYREPNGLAMSSRNERLSVEYRDAAPFIYKTLETAKSLFGTKSANKVTEWVINEFANHELLELEYFSIADVKTLKPVSRKSNKNKYRAFIAVYAGEIRLIDNIALN